MFRRILLIAIIIAGIVYAHRTLNSPSDLPVIAITQIIEHNTLDTVREGLIKGLEDKGYKDGKNIRIVYQNAHGQMTTAAQIVQHFANLKPKALIALSTQSAQMLQNLSQSQNIPLIFSAVTDPVAAKLVQDVKDPAKGITGVSDYMEIAPQLVMIKTFLPNLKTLGVLHNPSEVNSTIVIEKLEKEAHAQGIKVIRSPLNNTSEAVSATRNLLGKVEAIYFPNDNTAMAAVSSIVGIAHPHGTPVFANDQASVEKGALASLSYDRMQMGIDTARFVVEVLEKGATINEPTQVGGKIETVVSQTALKALHLSQSANLRNIKFVQ